MKELIESFVTALSTVKGYSENTCRAYRRDLLEFSDIIKASGLTAIDGQDEQKTDSINPAGSSVSIS